MSDVRRIWASEGMSGIGEWSDDPCGAYVLVPWEEYQAPLRVDVYQDGDSALYAKRADGGLYALVKYEEWKRPRALVKEAVSLFHEALSTRPSELTWSDEEEMEARFRAVISGEEVAG